MNGSTPRKAARGFAREVAEWAVSLLFLLFATTTVAQPFVVPTGSMESTVLIGDHMLVDKLAYAPPGPVSRYLLPYSPVRRGDIIVFRFPLNPSEYYVKRVIGMPGDHLRIVDKQVWVNGKPLVEPYKQHVTNYVVPYRDNFPGPPPVALPPQAQRMLAEQVANGELTVPPGNYFAMGDNRDDSSDSRFWGFVPADNIVGKPWLIFWSYDAPTEHWIDANGISLDHLTDLAQHFFTKTRWERTFRTVQGNPL